MVRHRPATVERERAAAAYKRLVYKRRQVRDAVRLHRLRKRNGIKCLRIHIAYRSIDSFIKSGLLATEQRDDDSAIERAIALLCRVGFRAIRAGTETAG